MAAVTQALLLAARSLVTTAISQAAGTAIGGMTAGGTLAAAYDGNTNQAAAASSQSSATTAGYVLVNTNGKDWGVGITKTITKFVATSPNNGGFRSDNVAVGYKLQGSTDNFSGSVVDLATGTANGTNSEVLNISGGSITTTTAYRYHRFVVNGNGANNTFVCELVFYEDI